MCATYIYLPESPGSCIFVNNVYGTTSESGGGKSSAFHKFMKYSISIHLHSNSVKLSFLLRMNIFTLKNRKWEYVHSSMTRFCSLQVSKEQPCGECHLVLLLPQMS